MSDWLSSRFCKLRGRLLYADDSSITCIQISLVDLISWTKHEHVNWIVSFEESVYVRGGKTKYPFQFVNYPSSHWYFKFSYGNGEWAGTKAGSWGSNFYRSRVIGLVSDVTLSCATYSRLPRKLHPNTDFRLDQFAKAGPGKFYCSFLVIGLPVRWKDKTPHSFHYLPIKSFLVQVYVRKESWQELSQVVGGLNSSARAWLVSLPSVQLTRSSTVPLSRPRQCVRRWTSLGQWLRHFHGLELQPNKGATERKYPLKIERVRK